MKKIIAFINPSVCDEFRKKGIEGGYANGYVAIPPTHPLYGIDYNNADNNYPIDIHGGLTFSDYYSEIEEQRSWDIEKIDNEPIPSNWWVLGFDTLHAGDNILRWSREDVIQETLRLRKQLMDVAYEMYDNLKEFVEDYE